VFIEGAEYVMVYSFVCI